MTNQEFYLYLQQELQGWLELEQQYATHLTVIMAEYGHIMGVYRGVQKQIERHRYALREIQRRDQKILEGIAQASAHTLTTGRK